LEIDYSRADRHRKIFFIFSFQSDQIVIQYDFSKGLENLAFVWSSKCRARLRSLNVFPTIGAS